jgi:hypothetical protein
MQQGSFLVKLIASSTDLRGVSTRLHSARTCTVRTGEPGPIERPASPHRII